MFVTKLLTESKPPRSRTRGGAPGGWGTERGVWGERPPAWVEPEEVRLLVGMASPGFSGKASIQPGNRERPGNSQRSPGHGHHMAPGWWERAHRRLTVLLSLWSPTPQPL